MKNSERSKPMRKDVSTIVIQPGLEFDTYWKDTGAVGIGPTLAVYVHEQEILRFDCFGPAKGHYHIFSGFENGAPGGERIFLKELSRTDQIARTIWEIENNLTNLICLIADENIRSFEIDRAAVESQLTLLRQNLEGQLARVHDYLKKK